MIQPDRYGLRGLEKTLCPVGEFFEVHVSRSFPLRNNVVFLQHKYLVKKFRPQMFPRKTGRSEEHTSVLQSLMRISYAVYCLKKKNDINRYSITPQHRPT